MINAALEYEFLRRQKKPIPDELQERLDNVFNWLYNLSDKDYAKLIH